VISLTQERRDIDDTKYNCICHLIKNERIICGNCADRVYGIGTNGKGVHTFKRTGKC